MATHSEAGTNRKNSTECQLPLRLALIALVLMATLFLCLATVATVTVQGQIETFDVKGVMSEMKSLLRNDVKELLQRVDQHLKEILQNFNNASEALIGVVDSLKENLDSLAESLRDSNGITLNIGV